MVRPGLRSRSLRRVYVKAPKGARLHHKYHLQAKATCRMCGVVLKGMKHGTNAQISKLSKSHKRPSRPFGGNLCSSCMRKTLVERAMVIRNG